MIGNRDKDENLYRHGVCTRRATIRSDGEMQTAEQVVKMVGKQSNNVFLSLLQSYLTRLEEKEARKYFQQFIDAVGHCHSKGVYHRDLKV